ncbi:universal stress protein [Marivita sp.]|uniref:universal stress protein n=1 Tax=Marivita sp. TaxID=2003365 RepID=UPI0025B81577|nr:universal stress protein [Marivita sp.]
MIKGAFPPRQVLAVMESGTTQTALLSAAALADRYGAALEVMACVEPPHNIATLARLSGRAPEQLLDALRDRTRSEMQALLASHLPGHHGQVRIAVGKTFVEIIRHVMASGSDFVVKAAEPLTGASRLLYASTDQHLLRKCPCPVWLQTEGARPVPNRVLATVDIDDLDADEPETLAALNRRVIDVARQVAAPAGSEVFVLHAWDAIGEGLVWAFGASGSARVSADTYVNDVLGTRRKALETLLGEVTADDPSLTAPRLVPVLVRGAPERRIVEQSRELGADLVVMGTVARTGLSGVFIGNTAENIINGLDCPVLAVKPDGFASPLAAR